MKPLELDDHLNLRGLSFGEHPGLRVQEFDDLRSDEVVDLLVRHSTRALQERIAKPQETFVFADLQDGVQHCRASLFLAFINDVQSMVSRDAHSGRFIAVARVTEQYVQQLYEDVLTRHSLDLGYHTQEHARTLFKTGIHRPDARLLARAAWTQQPTDDPSGVAPAVQAYASLQLLPSHLLPDVERRAQCMIDGVEDKVRAECANILARRSFAPLAFSKKQA